MLVSVGRVRFKDRILWKFELSVAPHYFRTSLSSLTPGRREEGTALVRSSARKKNHLISEALGSILTIPARLLEVCVEGAQEGGVWEPPASTPHRACGLEQEGIALYFQHDPTWHRCVFRGPLVLSTLLSRPIVQGRLHFSASGGERLRAFPELNQQEVDEGGPKPKDLAQGVRAARDLRDQGVKLPCVQEIKLSRWLMSLAQAIQEVCNVFSSCCARLCTCPKRPALTFKASSSSCRSASRTGWAWDLLSSHLTGISSQVFLRDLK